MPRTYEEIFENAEIVPDTPPLAGPDDAIPVPFRPPPFSVGLQEIAAIRKAEKRIRREKDALRKDGWSEHDIEEVFETYDVSWPSAFLQRRARQRRTRVPALDPNPPRSKERYTFGTDPDPFCRTVYVWDTHAERGEQVVMPMGSNTALAQLLAQALNRGLPLVEAIGEANAEWVRRYEPDPEKVRRYFA